ncbi:MAG: choice-of-anchor tandem repeat GloVer-containing protein [Candidatus Cybelea sp.]
MKTFAPIRDAVSSGAFMTLVVACATLQSPTREPAMMPAIAQPSSATYRVLHRFDLFPKQGGAENPAGPLVDVDGTFYGTTHLGGLHGDGTVYSITASGVKKRLYSFGTNSSDGIKPSAGLIVANGTLYGVTAFGGTCGSSSTGAGGTVFSVSTTGTENVLHSFCQSDGENPGSELLAVDGTLYGTTTTAGGTSGNSGGTVFSMSTSGGFKVLHSFNGAEGDGFSPSGPLLDVNETLYGTTGAGGTSDSSGCDCGTVYSITTAGKEKVLYSFQGRQQGSDGDTPGGALIDVNGILYGTTLLGGRGSCFEKGGCGVVYSITTSGAETVVYRFSSASHGQNPRAGLLDVNGTLYGTTEWGGGGSCELDSTRFRGCGTIYSLAASGAEQVLHAFIGGSDGAHPEASLIDVNGTLYGTTKEGGFKTRCAGNGCGTVFELSP